MIGCTIFVKFSDGKRPMDNHFRHVAEDLRREIESILSRVGLLCRVFGRGKDEGSLNAKLKREPRRYAVNGRLIQDAVGIRVALYFEEDIEIVARLLTSKFALDTHSSIVDLPATDQFSVTRHNLVFRMPEQYKSMAKMGVSTRPIDLTFEVQLRSILSEGWHEVDHDLRYKCKDSWVGNDDLSRALNGIVATIETADWSMRRIFDDLAYRHYRQKNWPAMLHSKIRMRVGSALNMDIAKLLDEDGGFAKEVFRVNRRSVIERLARLPLSLPLTLDNVVYVWNHIGPRNPVATELMPALIADALRESDTFQ